MKVKIEVPLRMFAKVVEEMYGNIYCNFCDMHIYQNSPPTNGHDKDCPIWLAEKNLNSDDTKVG